jgi:hypothetical protein
MRRARRNPTGGQWALIAAGAAATGLVVYLIFKPQPAQNPTVSTPAPTPTIAPPPLRLIVSTPAPTGPTYALAVNGDTSTTLKTGDTLALTLPPHAHTDHLVVSFAGSALQDLGDQSDGTRLVKAVQSGQAQIFVTFVGPLGATVAQYTVSVLVADRAGAPPVLQG